MSTPREQYDSMLDDLDAETKLGLIEHVPFAKLLEEVDPVAYRCGASDYQAQCDECRRKFYADDPDDEAVCPECIEAAKESDDEDTDDEAGEVRS